MQMPNLSYLYGSTAYQTHNLHKKYIIHVTSAGDRWELVFMYQVATQHPVTVCSCIKNPQK